jgi:DNA-binding GntR family transcriptional regulator
MRPAQLRILRRKQLATHIRTSEVLIAQHEARLAAGKSGDPETSEMLLQSLKESLTALLEYQRVSQMRDRID